MYSFWRNLSIPCFKLNISMNDDLFTMSWLLIISFIIIFMIVSFVEVYYIFLSIYDTILWNSFCVMLLFVSSQNLVVGSLCSFVYLFHPISLNVYFYFHCCLQSSYWINISIWSSHIGSCWLCITNFVQSWHFNLFLVFLNRRILFLVDFIVIVTLYVFLQIFWFVFVYIFFSL